VTRTWSLRFADDHGIAGWMRLAVGASPAPAAYLASFSLPGDGLVVVHDDDVPAPRGSILEVRADSLWAELLCETPGEHWSFGLEAFGLHYDDPREALVTDLGDRVAVGFDLEWETPDVVVGELLVGSRALRFDGRGTFEHRDDAPDGSVSEGWPAWVEERAL
jgi:hypothetical protein